MKFIHTLLRDADPLAAGSGGGTAVATPPAGGAVAAGAPATGGQPATGNGAAATPGPWHSGFVKADGTLDHGAFARLPDNLKGLAPSLANIKTADDLMAKFANLNALAGRKGLAPLPADAKPEDVAAHQAVIRSALGVPEKPDGYGLKRPDDLPENMWDEAGAKSVAELLHKHNGSPALAKELIAFEAQRVKAQVEAQGQYEQQFYKEQDDQFRAALQATGDDYDKSMGVITQTAKRMGVAEDSPLLKNASFRLAMKAVAKAIGEPATVTGTGSDNSTKSAKVLADAIVHDKTNPEYEAYWKAEHAKHGEVYAKVVALREQQAREDAAAAAAQGGRR